MLDRDRSRERRAVRLVVAAALAAVAAAALAESGEGQVIDTVPARSRDRVVGEIARLARAAGAGTPDARIRLARLALETARRRSDPRYLGQAEAALSPWSGAADVPEEVLLLRATLAQTRHDFSAALADLDRLLARNPGHAQAHLTRAVVLTVQGRYPEALRSCEALAAGQPALGPTCRAPALAATGRAAQAAAALEPALSGRPSPAMAWTHSVLGEIHHWSADPARAEPHLQAALRLDPGDRYTRGLLADLLLDGQRWDEVVALLDPLAEADDALLLRLAIAEQRRSGPRASRWTGLLRARFAAAARRGDRVHAREQARFALEIQGDARGALALALESWGVQREPWDARLVLEAARRAPGGPRELVQQVADFVAARQDGWRLVSLAAGARP
jgi:tetratricopeptide (TPR) repeat protein